MKRKRRWFRLELLILCLAAILSLCACTDVDVGQNTELSRQFMDHVLADNYDAAYGMVQATVSDADFREYWISIQAAVEGATSYEMEQIGWRINTTNGLTDRTTAYQVYPDNGHTVLLRVVTRDHIEGIAGIHFSDITDFLRETDAYVPTVDIILLVFSGLSIAFSIGMLVDCARRKMKYKALWMILIFFGIAVTITTGETSNLSFELGLFWNRSTIAVDPGIVSVVTKLVVPLGAILYLCLGRRFVIEKFKPDAKGNLDLGLTEPTKENSPEP